MRPEPVMRKKKMHSDAHLPMAHYDIFCGKKLARRDDTRQSLPEHSVRAYVKANKSFETIQLASENQQ